jgi:hypothetical protein
MNSSRPTLPRLEHGSVFAGYWIDRLLDRGGMGVVYKAMDIDLDRAVAVKLIAPEYTEDETAAVRFRRRPRRAPPCRCPRRSTGGTVVPHGARPVSRTLPATRDGRQPPTVQVERTE